MNSRTATRPLKIFGLFVVVLASCAVPLREPEKPGEKVKQALFQSGGNLEQALRIEEEPEAQAKKQPSSPLLERRAELADRCLSHVLRGVLICLPAADRAVGGDEKCDLHFSAALQEVSTLMKRAPGLMEVFSSGGTPPATERWKGLDSEDAPWMSCAASAVIWRSIAKPESEPDALAIPAALATLRFTDALEPSTLFALSNWTRAVLFSQTPAALGGKPVQAAKHFAEGLARGDAMTGFVAALQARFLCTAMQDYRCFLRAKERVMKANMFPGVAQVAQHYINWVEGRASILFPNDVDGFTPSTAQEGAAR